MHSMPPTTNSFVVFVGIAIQFFNAITKIVHDSRFILPLMRHRHLLRSIALTNLQDRGVSPNLLPLLLPI